LFNFFDVIGGDTGSHYRIHFDDCLNVEQLDVSGKVSPSFASCLRGTFPSVPRCWRRRSRLSRSRPWLFG
jgi:hypothetical protein